jgi:hypothetical protein
MPGFGPCGLDATLPNAALRALVKTRSSLANTFFRLLNEGLGLTPGDG